MLLDDNEAKLAQIERLADENIEKLKSWIWGFGFFFLIFTLSSLTFLIWRAIKTNMTFPPQDEEDLKNLMAGLFIFAILGFYSLRFLLHYRYINNYIKTKNSADFLMFLKKHFKIWKTLTWVFIWLGFFLIFGVIDVAREVIPQAELPTGPDTNIVVTSGDTTDWNR